MGRRVVKCMNCHKEAAGSETFEELAKKHGYSIFANKYFVCPACTALANRKDTRPARGYETREVKTDETSLS